MKRLIFDIFHNPLFKEVEASKSTHYLAAILAFSAVSTKLGFVPLWMQNVYYATCIMCFIFLCSNGLGKLHWRFISLYAVLGINVLLLSIDPIFSSKMRLMLFILVTLVCSSAIITPTALVFRHLLFKDIIIYCSLLVPVSCLCKFVGVNFVKMRTGDLTMAEQVDRVGLFGGLFQHSMSLGPIAAIVAISFFFAYQSYGRKKIYIILFVMSALACFFSASRGALLSLVVPISLALFSRKGDRDAKRSIRIIILLACLAIFPFADIVFSGVMEKQQRNVEMGSTFGSRTDKFTYRWEEFMSSPLMGVGFAAIDPASGDAYGNDGTIEPGSSHMAVLSMTGLSGALFYLIIILFAYSCVKGKGDTNARYRKALLIAVVLHGCWEGYVFSGGGFLCLLYWIIFAQCMDYKFMKNYGML